jgi:hypothetical protein
MDHLVINRQTYSLLDWLGDLGGLMDALYVFCHLIVAPIATFNMQAVLMAKLFRERPSETSFSRQSTAQTNEHFFSKYFAQ